MATVKEMLKAVRELPVLPASAVQIMAMLGSGDADARQIEKVARRDEALSMTILRFANSAQYGRPGRVFNLNESITRLGNATLMKIIVQQQTSGLFARAGSAYGLQRGALWRGSLGGAIAAEQIAHDQRFDDPELCYLSAMLRDVGKLVMDARYGNQYISSVIGQMLPERTFVEAERAAFGFDHAELGAGLAEHWSLPERIVHAIRHHHEPPANAPLQDPLFDIVHAADIVCLWGGLAIGYDGLQYKLAEHVRQDLRLDRRQVEGYIALTWSRLVEMESSMGQPCIQGKTA
jgi:HD-like signal output (HDOD) protein